MSDLIVPGKTGLWLPKHESVRNVRLVLPALHVGQIPIVRDPHRIVVATAGSKLGKAESVATLIPTTCGKKPMLDIQIGDRVFDEHGNAVEVTWVTPVQHGKKCYRVRFGDGHESIVSGEHLWWVEARRSSKTSERLAGLRPRTVLTTEELKDDLYTAERICVDGKKRPAYKWRVPATEAVRYSADDHDAQLPIDPYLLGTWLGDGCGVAATITSADEEVLQSWRDGGWSLRHLSQYDYGVTGPTRADSLITKLRILGVCGNKQIPRAYMMASVSQRTALLRGLMDTDGSAEGNRPGRNGKVSKFYNTNKALADGFRELAESLGCVVTMREKRAKCNGKDCGLCYCLAVKSPFNPFSLKRKADRWAAPVNGIHRSIVAIEPVESAPVKCIEVDSPTHLYLTDGFIPTHNTYGLAIWLTMEAFNSREGATFWWAAPTFKQCTIASRLIESFLPKHLYNLSRTDMCIELLKANGDVRSRIEFRSADNPGSLRGSAVTAAVADEAAYWSYESFVSLFTTLSRTRGRLRLISTPKGRNWFYHEFIKGKSEDFPEHACYQLPTWLNPYVPPESIAEFKRSMPDAVFRQEIAGEFLEDGAGVFKNITKAQRAKWLDKPVAGVEYGIGVDLGRKDDYTFLCIIDLSRKAIVHAIRMNELDWNLQIDRIIRTAKAWNDAFVLVDETGLGDVVLSTLRAGHARSDGYNMGSNAKKAELIQSLQLALEQQTIMLPDPKTDTSSQRIASILQHELEIYGYEISITGKFQFSAPQNFHDDGVIACALANWLAQNQPRPVRFKSVRGV